MKRAALILYGDNSNKMMFWVFGKPCKIGKVDIKLDQEDYEIFIFEIPHAKYKNKMKQRSIIEKLCGENNIQSVFYIDDVDEQLENLWYSIKVICILREIEAITGQAVLSKSFGIVGDILNPVLLEAISEEASSIMVLKEGLDQNLMKKMYGNIMTDTGLSIAFVSDLKFLIKQSDIVIWESSKHVSSCINVKKTLVLAQAADYLKPDSVQMKYKEEISMAVVSFIPGKSIWEIASCFPFVYLSDEHGNPIAKDWVCSFLIRSNKALTIQKC